MIFMFICLILLINIVPESFQDCVPDALGQFKGVSLGSVANITTHAGNDVHFICCGGTHWTFDPLTGQPETDIHSQWTESSISTLSSSTYPNNSVTSMLDDRQRLILQIHNALPVNSGRYICKGGKASTDAYLEVVVKKNSEHTIVQQGAIIPHFVMFSFADPGSIKLKCPTTETQTVKSWTWSDVNTGETFKTNQPGLHSTGGQIEIGPRLEWARIISPSDAPTKLWCQFEVESTWQGRDPIMAYYEIDWELYEPISPKVLILRHATSDQLQSNLSTDMPWLLPDSELITTIRQLELGQADSSSSSVLLEGKPVQLACRFRPLQVEQGEGRSSPNYQQVDWYRNGQPISVPPFRVENELLSSQGISLLSTRAFPASTQSGLANERFTCKVTSELKQDPVYRIENNASLDVEVILVPVIIGQPGDSTSTVHERSLGQSISFTCMARVNGLFGMQFERRLTDTSGDRRRRVRRQAQHYATVDTFGDWVPVEASDGPTALDASDPLAQTIRLDIAEVKQSDHGTYLCSVWNEAGRDQDKFSLLVQSPPLVEVDLPESSYFTEHLPWKVNCLVRGYPLAFSLVDDRSETGRDAFVGAGDDSSSTTKPVNNEDGSKHPVKLLLLDRNDQQPIDSFKVKSVGYRADKFSGINASYTLQLIRRERRQVIVRCAYTHSTGEVLVSNDLLAQLAVPPPQPNITVLCVGAQAVVFAVTNPRYDAESFPVNRIVNQKVIFWNEKYPQDDSPSNEHTLDVFLDSQGQPTSQAITDSGRGDLITSSPPKTSDRLTMSSHGSIVPIHDLLPNTKYQFEWSSANQFGLSVVTSFNFQTGRIEPPPRIERVEFLRPTSKGLQLALDLDDPCPYDEAARPLLTGVKVRYRHFNATLPKDKQQQKPWSEIMPCQGLSESSEDKEMDTDVDPTSLSWSDWNKIHCSVSIDDVQSDYELQVATSNTFGISAWFNAVYQYAKLDCYPRCGSSILHLSGWLLTAFLFASSLLRF